MSKHTPGPWRVEQSTRTDQRIVAGNRWIATASNHDFHPTQEENERTKANARLIAAAPNLLLHLARLVECLSAAADDGAYDEQISAALEAIAKATGEQS